MAPESDKYSSALNAGPALADAELSLLGGRSPVAKDSRFSQPKPDIGIFARNPANIKLEKGGTSEQRTFWSERTIWKETIVAKLNSIGRADLSAPFAHCATYETILECTGCGRPRIVWNHCDKVGCPVCADRISRKKKDKVKAWAGQIAQPKHITLTVQNKPTITVQDMIDFKAHLKQLRRSKAFAEVSGGCWSIETTNIGNGWHIHCHLLVDAKWITFDLAKTWAEIVGQDVAIVKVKDCRQKEYLQEVIKYAAKGNEIASWTPDDIAMWITAVSGQRLFGTFGTLYKERSKVRAILAEAKKLRGACECGCNSWRSFSPQEYDWKKIQAEGLVPYLERQCKAAPTQAQMQIWRN